MKNSANADPIKALKDQCDAKKPPTALLILAQDTVRRQRCIKMVLDACPSPFDITRYQAKDLKIANLKSAFATQGLFSKHAVFIISDVDSLNAEALRGIADALATVPPGNTVILQGEKLASNSAFLKSMKGREQAIELPELKGADLKRWAAKEIRANDLICPDDDVLDRLILCSEDSPDRLESMIEQISLYQTDEDRTFSRTTIDELFIASPAAHEFELADAVASRNVVKMEILISSLLKLGKSPFMLIPLLARTFGYYLSIAAYLEKGLPPQQIRQEMAIAPWLFAKYFETSKRYSVNGLRKNMAAILLADSKIKNNSLGHEIILSELLSELAS